jgi:hypothetical protein
MAEVSTKIRKYCGGVFLCLVAGFLAVSAQAAQTSLPAKVHAPSTQSLSEGKTSAEPPVPTAREDEKSLSEGKTSDGPPIPIVRPDGQSLDEGKTSGEPPVPATRPDQEILNEGRTSAEAPVPMARPDEQSVSEGKTSGTPPIPTARPELTVPSVTEAGAVPIQKPEIPRPTVSADEMRACLAELASVGADFVTEEPVSDPSGCAIPNPVTLKNLGKTVKLAPAALLDCPMAVAAVRFMRDVASPEAERALGSGLASVSQASGYVCRPRNGTTKLSEHAFGNALDIASFGLADGRHIDVRATPPEVEAKFLDAVRKAACGPFKTVLGPGSDADHALHFHFDLAPRRHGGTFCQ